jgi:2-keto-4-pentenoate hydratase
MVLHPGLEIAGSRWLVDPPGRKITTYDLIADSGTGGGYVTSSDLPDWRGLDLEHMSIEARIDGGVLIPMCTGDSRGDPVETVVETVNELMIRGRGLAKGDLISTGTLTQPTVLLPGQTLVGRFGNLATVSVTMER